MKKQMARIVTVLLSSVLFACLVLQIDMPAYAAEGTSAMVIGSQAALKETANTDEAQTVKYAGNEWRVISYDGTGNTYTKTSGAMTLFSSATLFGKVMFNTDKSISTANDYAGSNLQKQVNNGYNSLFSSKEKAAVLNRTLSVDEYNGANYPNTSGGVSGTATSGYLWPLSTLEAAALPSNSFRSEPSSGYWLRSPGAFDDTVAFVAGKGSAGSNGVIITTGMTVNTYKMLRLAFNLDLSSIVLTSAVEGGKSSGPEGANALSEIGTTSGNEWKLTLLDDGSISGLDGHKSFNINPLVTMNGDILTIKYTGAATGTGEYISAVVTDSAGAVLYYGRIKACTLADDASDTITINTAGKWDRTKGDKLYVFNEQYNGNDTDYASKLIEIAGVWQGEGTEEHPYTIEDEEGWNALSSYVAAGNSTEGLYFKLDDDISVTESVGTGSAPFAGVFDGNGRSLNFVKTATGQNAAPFAVTNNAVFKHLHTMGNIETRYKFAAGLVGTANGTTIVTDCSSSMRIYSSVNGDGTHGGFVGIGDVTFEGCVDRKSVV